MTRFQKPGTNLLLKWVFSNLTQNQSKSSKTQLFPTGYSLFSINTRNYRTKKASQTENPEKFGEQASDVASAVSRSTRREAQAALLDYFYSTRGIQFLDAESMSKHSPRFLEKLLKQVKKEADVGRSISRFLSYHPINEFEPFFESLGLKPSEYVSLLPRELIYLRDDRLLIENYNALRSYGFLPKKIGKIYKEALEVFRYEYGILMSKLVAYENLGLTQSIVVKLIVCCPRLLIGDVNVDFVKVLEEMNSLGLEVSWVVGNLLEGISYNWRRMLEFLFTFSKIGFSKEQLVELISKSPVILFEGSGDRTYALVAFLLKFGLTMNQISSMLLQFPQIQVGKFVSNLRKCYLFLSEIEMEVTEIRKFLCSHALLVGSCELKRTNSLLCNLNVGKKRLCDYIRENPEELKNWVMGARIGPLPGSKNSAEIKFQKNKFLLDLGFVENSDEMKKALKVFRGKAVELQERFDFIRSYGLDWEDVREMVKISPQILNQKKDVIQKKIDFLVNDLGFPLSALVAFPSYLNYTVERVKLRFSLYNWLKEQRLLEPELSLSTIVAASETAFIKRFVHCHPSGPQVWLNLQKNISSN
ncbi:hypothetical protein UlMin_005168 [Ulmus minor]